MIKQVRDNWDWANSYLPAITDILRANAMYLVSIRVADADKDMKYATDMLITIEAGDVAVRVRRDNCRFRDLTLRAWLLNGKKTELAKIKEGCARWYFYAWTNQAQQIGDWMLVDLDKLRVSGLLESPAVTENKDGRTGFASFPIQALRTHDCLIAFSDGLSQ